MFTPTRSTHAPTFQYSIGVCCVLLPAPHCHLLPKQQPLHSLTLIPQFPLSHHLKHYSYNTTLQHLCLPNPISNHATSHPEQFPSLWRTLGLCCFRRPLGWLFIIKTSTHVQLHFNLHLNDVSAVTGASSLLPL